MPLYHRVVIPDAFATLVNGSVYVTVTGAVGNLYGTDWLDHGDIVEFGAVNEVFPLEYNAMEWASLALVCRLRVRSLSSLKHGRMPRQPFG
jgi:hypothetical protein